MRFRITALLGALAVGLGASGAHGSVHKLLLNNGTLEIWEKAVFYQFIHTVAMLALTLYPGDKPRSGPWFCFLAGILFFSGSLYLLAFTNVRWLGAITPVGGVSFIAGWLCLAFQPPLGPSGPGKETSDS